MGVRMISHYYLDQIRRGGSCCLLPDHDAQRTLAFGAFIGKSGAGLEFLHTVNLVPLGWHTHAPIRFIHPPLPEHGRRIMQEPAAWRAVRRLQSQ